MEAQKVTERPYWSKRSFATGMTLAGVIIASTLFTVIFRANPGDKPIFFCRMLLGPFDWMLDEPYWEHDTWPEDLPDEMPDLEDEADL